MARIRAHVRAAKVILADTLWRTDDMPAKYSVIYPRLRPIRADWQWRSVRTSGANHEYVFLTQLNTVRDNWMAWLISCDPAGGSIICRYEYHGSHPGYHAHAHCDRGGLEIGPTSIGGLARLPKVSTGPVVNLRRDLFWENARKAFRIEFPAGTLV